MRLNHGVIILICILCVSGCIQSKDKDSSKREFRCSDGRIVSEPMLCITERTTTRQTTTITETSSSTKPPLSFLTTTSTTTKKPLLPQVKTTTLVDLCSNDILDEGEDIIDCGSMCDCRLLTLPSNGLNQQHPPSGYFFAFNSTIYVKGGECGRGGWPTKASYFHVECKNKKYVINITTLEPLVDVRYISPRNSYFIDDLEFGILKEDEDSITIAVRHDPATENLSKEYAILSVGGSGCGFKDMGLCRREYLGYKLRLLEREKDKVKLDVTAPDGDILPKTWVEKTPTKIRDLEVGVIHPITLGGYATIYVK